jgi:galactofuranosylgalactofuranosylrhamnosyl-N-acetylglucosaminyl-diphospho-decaprenol beta-1,5/1,6-galactofuranosyltransferase
MANLVLQQFVMPCSPRLSRLYFRSKARGVFIRRNRRRSVVLSREAVLKTDTFFNGFFEDYWRKYTSLEQLDLRVRTSGAGTLRLFRRAANGSQLLLGEVACSGDDREVCLPILPPTSTAGLLSFDLRCHSDRLVMHAAEWVARDVVARPVQLCVGYCTYEREGALLANLKGLLRDSTLTGLLTRVIVVDQGGRKVRDYPGYRALAERAKKRLVVIEQDNLGGAGGFTRCILQARADSSATHILLTDDDAVIEPESVRRAGMFLALCRGDAAVAGHLLDRRRPTQLVEVGSTYDPDLVAVAPAVRRRADRRSGLARVQQARHNTCSGWWCFAFPLKVIERVGLPLPLFLRGDDAEFGCRLASAGVPGIPLPGVAVRHEAIDRARRDWQEYYDLRNMLILGAIHFRLSRRSVVRRFLSGLVGALLTYRYDRSWLLCEAVQAYLKGPVFLRGSPQRIHRHLLATWKSMAPKPERVGGALLAPPPSGPRSRLTRLVKALWHVSRNLIMADPALSARPELALSSAACDWHAIGSADVVTAPGGDDGNRIELRRARASFAQLLARGLWLSLRLFIEHRRTARAWRKGATNLTTPTFWRGYLGLDPATLPEAPHGPQTIETACDRARAVDPQEKRQPHLVAR